jgi:hypothetical protein
MPVRLAVQAQQSFDAPSSFDSCLCSKFDVGRWTLSVGRLQRLCLRIHRGAATRDRHPLAGCVQSRHQPKDLQPALNLMRETERDLAPRPRLRVTRFEKAIHEFGRHRHHDQSKNPAHHTTGSKLVPRRAVLKFNLDTIHRPFPRI